MKKIFVRVILFILCLAVLSGASFLTVSAAAKLSSAIIYDRISTTDINDYTRYYHRFSWYKVFPENIPESASGNKFVFYYDEQNNIKDVYLELTFNSADDMALYLNNIKKSAGSPYILEKENPGNQAYKDIYMFDTASYKAGERHLYYEIDGENADKYILANFNAVSYSYHGVMLMI